MNQYDTYNKGGLLRNRYRKVADILRGLYGLVSVASDTVENRLVAVKYIYPLEKATEVVTLRSNTQELVKQPLIEHTKSVLQALNDEAGKEIYIHKILGCHPNIATLYDHFDFCLVLEYCPKGDLYDAIQEGKGPSTSQDIKDVFGQILDALEYTHAHNVYHRDLKPENILIGEDWLIKLCDWGLATTQRIITNKNEFDVGSERYMAPELFDPSLVDFYDALKIDLWLIGIILLTLVFQKNPFKAANQSDKRFIQFVTNREALFDIFSTMSGEMFSVLRYCLNIDPENRDLPKLRGEVEKLKFFTIDEEYWASEYEEESDEEDLDEKHDLPSKSTDKDKLTELTGNVNETKSIPVIETPVPAATIGSATSNLNPSSNTISNIPRLSPSNIPLSTPDLIDLPSGPINTVSPSPSGYSIPHNHRADALLSANTSALPIPIDVPNFRTQRKPFGVASYAKLIPQNQLQLGAYRFNREDFFTPKSVFNHYMDKYKEGEFDGHGNGNGNGHSNNNGYGSSKSSKKRKGRKFKLWKKATIDSDNYELKKSQLSSSHKQRNQKPSRRFTNSPSNLQQFTGGFGKDTIHNGSGSVNLAEMTLSSSQLGKYVPPNLRSPAYHPKSPLAQPLNMSLAEDIGSLTLEDDEVFHLEGDFDDLPFTGGPDSSTIPNGNGYLGPISTGLNSAFAGTHNGYNSTSSSTSTRRNINFKTPVYSGYHSSNEGSSRFSDNPRAPVAAPAPAHIARRNSLSIANANVNVSSSKSRAGSATSGPNNISIPLSNQQLWSNNGNNGVLGSSEIHGKYVPPFRRGSQPIAHSKTSSSTNTRMEDKRRSHHELTRDQFYENTTSSSVPTGKADWLLFKKDWGDYDDSD